MMKLSKWLTCLQSAIFAFLLSFSGIACLCTAFEIGADLGLLALWCGIFAVVFSFFFTVKLGFLPLCALALLAGYLWQEGSLSLSMEALLNHISFFYHKGYGIGVVAWSGQVLADADKTLGLLAAAVCMVPVVAWTVCRQGWAAGAVIVSLLPLAACLVVTDTVPDSWCLMLLFFALAVLLLSQTARRTDAMQGNLLAALAAVPAALAVLALFLAVPRSGYTGQQQADKILQQVQQLLSQQASQTGIWVASREDLSSLGNNYNPHLPVMDITAETGGTIYLREQVFDTYDGTGWTFGDQYADLNDFDVSQFPYAGQVEIATSYVNAALYVPCLTGDAPLDSRGVTENTERWRTYSFDRWRMPVKDGWWLGSGAMLRVSPQLPESTLSWGQALVDSFMNYQVDYASAYAEAIADYVRQSAAYSKSTERMPAEETDFVRWFLEESDTGYCVHFASATAVLLQAEGVPARYVTGYMVQAEANEPTTVYMDDAHAWVEYYIPHLGWIVLESTPAEGLPTLQTQQTEPSETTEPETTTQPADTTTPESTPAQAPDTPTETKPTQQKQDPGWLVTVLAVLGYLLGAGALIIGQWRLRLWWRDRKMTRGTPNQRAVACWREAVFFARLLKEKPDAGLFALAQKAKFSQYTLEKAELAQFEAYLRRCRIKLRKKPFFQRLLFRLIFAAY